MEKPFSPALKAFINMITQNAQIEINKIVNAEASSLELPAGWQANVANMTWVLPSLDEDKKE